MSLCSLKKSRPTAKRSSVSVDDFIEDALLYSSGQKIAAHNTVMQNGWQDDFELGDLIPLFGCSDNMKPMRRATFTLSESSINALSELAEMTGISRSRLIRIWIEQQYKQRQHGNLLSSRVQ